MSWRVFDVQRSCLRIMSHYEPKFDLKVNVSHSDQILQSSNFDLYLGEYLMCKHHTYGLWVSMTWSLTPNKCRSQWPIFLASVILPYILKSIWCIINIILMDYESDAKLVRFYIDIYICVSFGDHNLVTFMLGSWNLVCYLPRPKPSTLR